MRNPNTRLLPLLLFLFVLPVPAAVQAQDPGPIPVGNHFKCYDIVATSPVFNPIVVNLKDQFYQSTAQVLQPVYLCNPVIKNGSAVPHPNLHLVCYQIQEPTPAVDRRVNVRNQFGLRTHTVRTARLLCLPSSKILVP